MKTKYIVIGLIALFLVGGVIAETLKDIIVSKETYTALTTTATKDGLTVEQKAGSLLDKAITEQLTAEQRATNEQLEKDFGKYRAKCRELNKMQECINALKLTTQ
jgi:hypothetical protein